jgi:hypothetical protein
MRRQLFSFLIFVSLAFSVPVTLAQSSNQLQAKADALQRQLMSSIRSQPAKQETARSTPQSPWDEISTYTGGVLVNVGSAMTLHSDGSVTINSAGVYSLSFSAETGFCADYGCTDPAEWARVAITRNLTQSQFDSAVPTEADVSGTLSKTPGALCVQDGPWAVGDSLTGPVDGLYKTLSCSATLVLAPGDVIRSFRETVKGSTQRYDGEQWYSRFMAVKVK